MKHKGRKGTNVGGMVETWKCKDIPEVKRISRDKECRNIPSWNKLFYMQI